MYFSPIILTSFQPLFCNYYANNPSFTKIPLKQEIQENTNTITCAAQKFAQVILSTTKDFQFSLNTNYMNLNKKFDSIKLLSYNEFISYYDSVINRYKTTYGNYKLKHSWSQQDVVILLWVINWLVVKKQVNPLNFQKDDWSLIASVIPFRSGDDCMFKWLSMRNNQLEEHPWTQKQKILLVSIVQSNQQIDWINVSKLIFEQYPEVFRTPKQCKQSYSIIVSSRNDRSKKFWSFQQDNALFEAFSKYGRKWKHIASMIEGRSQNAIKNRFTLLSQKYCSQQIKSKNDKHLILFVQSKLQQQATLTTNNI